MLREQALERYLDMVMVRLSNVVYNAKQPYSSVTKEDIVLSLKNLIDEYNQDAKKNITY